MTTGQPSAQGSLATVTWSVGGGLPAFDVRRGSTALMIIDMQYADASREHGIGQKAREAGRADLLDAYFSRVEDVVVPNLLRLVDASRRAQIPIVYARMMSHRLDGGDLSMRHKHFGFDLPPGSQDAEILEELAPEEGDIVLGKTTSGIFNGTNVDVILRNLGIDTIIMTGVTTDNCVDTSTRGAGDLGYRTILVDDACAAFTPSAHEYAVNLLHQNFAYVRETDEIVVEIDGVALLDPATDRH